MQAKKTRKTRNPARIGRNVTMDSSSWHRNRDLLLHFLAAIAYRTQKALRDAPDGYPDFSAGNRSRTPVEILRHMTSLMGYTRTHFEGGSYPRKPKPLATFEEEIARFHQELERLAGVLEDVEALEDETAERLLQGPLSDTMTHVGQLAYLRRLAGSPVPPENFFRADVTADRLGPDQPRPADPDEEWPEGPE